MTTPATHHLDSEHERYCSEHATTACCSHCTTCLECDSPNGHGHFGLFCLECAA